ncbi:DHA3 family multidrug efflux protein-like MFS transporter [Novosphingobium chloroacetimidivorans]|uniref:DHA3 family multidrug efflux protein-like MFS transporter n=1 Tax=Novosphingobium chloroacetimidivorans TaxID=1428314 RepID=A0A7W7KEP1_9SPHN|nr:MFS transporter [Novosphingobium chloroacetimidivorans]MBB4861046.1 DHA3 family multidrug efflux protein-like MFS transporter [Novosphingobium chloroacetimidivorans]
MRPFNLVLGNSLIQNATNFTVWFALLFWAFLETRSVFVTGVVGGIYMVLTAGSALWFGSLVDDFGKKRVMLASSAASLILYVIAYGARLTLPEARMGAIADWPLWVFILLVMAAVIGGNLRMIALPTLVTALISEPERARANGLVGIVNGAGLVVTSAISGFLVTWGGMQTTLLVAIALTALAIVHLSIVRFEEPAPAGQVGRKRRPVDLGGTIAIIRGVPRLFSLIIFSSFNNLLGGVFMALLDAYGLSLMTAQEWGLLWALASSGFVISGILISRIGLGRNPLRTLLIVNVIIWSVASVFTLQSSVIALGIGCFVYLALYPIVEAAEQTALQKLVPYECQGRVMGFAQSAEQAAAPLTSFIVGPLTQFVVIPFMSKGAGARAIGSWYGTGPERGMAVMFTISGVLGVVTALLALKSRSYRELSAAYHEGTRPSRG